MPRAQHPAQPVVTEAEIDEVIAEFGGDPRETVRALLHDIAVLAAGYEEDVSRGFVRGEFPRLPRRSL